MFLLLGSDPESEAVLQREATGGGGGGGTSASPVGTVNIWWSSFPADAGKIALLQEIFDRIESIRRNIPKQLASLGSVFLFVWWQVITKGRRERKKGCF